MIILDGKKINQEIASSLKEAISQLELKPTLLIIQVGHDPASEIYIKKKKEFAEQIGAKVIVKNFVESVDVNEIISEIERSNENILIQGIIIQLPIPLNFDRQKILNTISQEKDVDGLGLGKNIFVPATVRGILTLIEKNKIILKDKKVVIVNDSELVGKPTARELERRGCWVEVCNDKTENLKDKTKTAEILITAIGKPEVINDSYLSNGQIIIDVGISQTKNGIRGDVARDLKTNIQAITPVPGGVGPMTVASLFQNLLDSYQMQQK